MIGLITRIKAAALCLMGRSVMYRVSLVDVVPPLTFGADCYVAETDVKWRGEEIFVDAADGSDVEGYGDGSFEKPYKSIARALKDCGPGDVIKLRGARAGVELTRVQ